MDYRNAKKEVGYYAEVDGIGLKCKCDLVEEGDGKITVYDLKTTVSPLTLDSLEKFFRTYEVHYQAHYYRKVVEAATGKKVDFKVVMISKKEPYSTVRLDVGEEMMDVGEMIFKRRMGLIKMGVKGRWKVWDKFRGKRLFFPEWYLSKVEKECQEFNQEEEQ